MPDDRRRPVPMVRAPGSPLPCQWCPKIPKNEKPCPENAVEPAERSFEALDHYRECKSVGFTAAEQADPIVRRNARIIARADAQWERQPLQQVAAALSVLSVVRR